jgi:hypothetical protein
MRWAMHIAHMGRMKNAYKSFLRRPEGKSLLGRPRRRWEDNTRTFLKETAWEVVDWIHLP